MQERIITIYCLCDEFRKTNGFMDHPWTNMSTAEVMTTALVAADMFGGCFEQSRAFLSAHGYIPHMLSKSRFNRRLHALPESLWQGLFYLLSAVAKRAMTGTNTSWTVAPSPCVTTFASVVVISIAGRPIVAILPANGAISLACAFISW